MKAAKLGTIRKGRIIHPILEELGLDPASIESVRTAGQGRDSTLHHANGLRLWENDDLVPRTGDVFQERLYCVRWISDPPYADAINYHELSDYFVAWHGGFFRSHFPEWADAGRKALAVTGDSENFRRSMVDCYRNLAKHMPANGRQVVMFTHQDSAVWADLALILWAAGLQVSSAWCIATETGGLQQGTCSKIFTLAQN